MREEQKYDFEMPVSRHETLSLKWDRYRGRNVIPLWVADMDFRAPPAVIEALQERVRHGIFGYASPPRDMNSAVAAVLQESYGWKVEPDWFVWLPGVVSGLNLSCRAVGKDQDDVLTLVPVYPPFLAAPRLSRRNLVRVRLEKKNDRWVIDLERLEHAITTRTSLLLLCSPHNPVGRAFDREELTALAEICLRRNIIICSDEIHCGLVLDEGRVHIPTAALGPEMLDRTITLMAPSKTYNIPGLGCSFAIIPNRRLRERFCGAKKGIVPHVGVLSYTAALASYQEGNDWLVALLSYLRGNRRIVAQAIRQMPGLSMTHVEATYLAWINTQDAGLESAAEFFERAGVGLSDGRDFDGSGYVRLNFGCPRATLGEALQRMGRALESG